MLSSFIDGLLTHWLLSSDWQNEDTFKLSVLRSLPSIKIFSLQRSLKLFSTVYQSVIIIPAKGSVEERGIKFIVSKEAFH